ncbi:DUF4259 domain-containing protein [Streptomyces sp. NPDC005279]|uniref:DUF4259 domain-containing protein n=1 Tax=Streptomyces sp. NPDC005279 TaxID=3364712 RepID=UPI003675152B
MGTWDVGPFDNDTAAEFSGDLDQAPAADRGGLIRNTLVRAIGTYDYPNLPQRTPLDARRRGCP